MKVKTIEEVIAFLQPIAEAVGVEIVDAEWNMREKSLTVFIDREEGVDLITCEKFHRAIDAPLDELDPTFGEGYTLNCSSPGLDRPFKKPRDFERNMGKKVEVKLYVPVNGKKAFEGVLRGYDGTQAVIQTENGELTFATAQIAKMCLAIDFD